jgi:hypothetical protein
MLRLTYAPNYTMPLANLYHNQSQAINQLRRPSQEALAHTKLPTQTTLPFRNLHPIAKLTILPLPTPHSSITHTPGSSHPCSLPTLILPLQAQFLLFRFSSFPLRSFCLKLRL